jgi:RHS repeat-associated protein
MRTSFKQFITWLVLACLFSTSMSVLAAGTATTTTLASATNPSSVGATSVLTATVTGTAAPTGTVTFKDGATVLGTATLTGTGNTKTATFTATFTTVATHSLTAVYAGDAGNLTSTSAARSQVVSKSATTSTVASSLNPAGFGASITLSASVTGYTPTGTVTFKDGATTLGTGTLVGTVNTRTATLAIATLSLATHPITVVYAGDTLNTTSTSAALSQVVTAKATTNALTSSLASSGAGVSVTLTSTISGGSSPTGTVTFYDGATAIGTGAVASSKATLAIATLSVGTHSIKATYGGDANNAASTSAVVTQTVTIKTTTLTLTSSANPSTYGGSTTLTATIAGGYAPTGSITFKDGATTLGTSTVASNKATLAIATLSAGTHSITASYTGDGNNTSSTAAALTQTVSIKTSAITLSSNANPSAPGNAVTLTATVTGTNPTGTVNFMDGAASIGTGSLTAGVATLSTSALSTATHSLTAVYSGDAGNSTSTSAALSQVVTTKTLVNITLSSNNPAPTYGDSITLMTTVTGTGGTPTGSVTFKNGTTTLGTKTLAAGTASLITTTLPAGVGSITAVYAGDATFANGTSAVLSQPVNKAATSIVLTVDKNPVTNTQAATFTATVNGRNPTGNVTFKDAGVTLSTVALTSGVASSTYQLSAGYHKITASYAGNANNLPSGDSNVVLQASTYDIAPTYQFGYDANGNLNTVVDPLTNTTNSYSDALNRKIQEQRPGPTVTSTAFDANDSVTRVTDPRNLATTYSPNGIGNVSTQSSPDTGATGMTYDALGNLLSKTDARAKVTTYTYDALNRLTSVTYSSGTPVILTYDGGATPTPGASGELTRMSDESGNVTYTYDSAGRLSSKTQLTNGKTFTLTYAYGETGPATDKITSITYPSGNRANFTYGADGNVSGITVDPVGANGTGFGANRALLSAITTNAYGKVTNWSWSNGLANPKTYYSNGLEFSYELGNAAGTANAAGVTRLINRDSANHIIGYNHSSNGAALDQSFGYDNLDRLTIATIAGVTTSYTYDKTNNRTSKVIGATTYANTVSPTSNRNVTVKDVGGTYSVVHDAAGNVTSDGVNTYAYSDRGRMASATTAGGTVSYLFNAFGQRVYKAGPVSLVPTGASYYVYDEAGKLLGEYDSTGVPIFETVYLANTPVGAIKQTGTAAGNNIAVALYNVYADHLSAPRVITRQADNAIVWRWDTAESYGGSAPNQDPSGLGAFVYNIRFPGQVFDAETGLFQNWNREYNPRIGRYMQSDPIGLAGGINTYGYVEGNPLSYVDPTGEIFQFIAPVIIVAATCKIGWDFNEAAKRRDANHNTPENLVNSPNDINANNVEAARLRLIQDAAKLNESVARKIYKDPLVEAKKIMLKQATKQKIPTPKSD